MTRTRTAAVTAAAALLLLLLPVSPAHADRKVYLNGVDLADVDVSGHSFDGCSVRFDDKGNVHITVKGLKVTAAATDQPAPPPANTKELGKSYFLVVKPVQTGGERYQVSVYINGTLAHLVKGSPKMQVHDVTRYIKDGNNVVRMISAVEMAAGAKKAPSQDLEIVLGQGTRRKGTVLIQLPHAEYRRPAKDSRRHDKTFRFETGQAGAGNRGPAAH